MTGWNSVLFVKAMPLMSRVYKRFQIALPAIVTFNPNEQGERCLLLKTVDISASGSMFCSEQSFSPDTPVRVVFLLKQGNSQGLKVTFAGRVVRSVLGRFAVAFDEIHPITLSAEGVTIETLKGGTT